MIDHRATVKRILFSALFFLLLSVGNKLSAQDGKAIFQNNCASCHSVFKDLTGPALGGVTSRGPWTDHKKLYEWVHNPAKFMASDPYTSGLKQKFGGVVMTSFDGLSEKEIDAVIDYVEKTFKAGPPTANPAVPGGGGAVVMDEKDNSILYGVLTLILAVVALIMLQVNSNLKKLADDKDGVPAYEPIPFYRNKSYITILVLLLFVIGGFYIVKGAIGLGRSKDYQPEQPIFYSHKVHAGVNQINCLYCHGGAMEGKHANIPSVNVCMNCHMTISEYSGSAGKLFREDGTEVNGTDEIKKIYAAAGWDASKKQYKPNEGHEIAWTKIHNLPDHVFFSHAQHVNAGKVQCQTCHGEITKMDEVKQFADLSMGWCINCHRTTKVNFGGNGEEGNKFYSIYKKFHDEMKNDTIMDHGQRVIRKAIRDSVTVNDIGGLECQKCHY